MRLLIVRLSAMGDVIHTLPVAANARAAGATVGWVVERGFAGVLQGNPDVDSLFVADTQAWRRRPLAAETLLGARGLRDRLRAFAPDRVLDAQGLWKTALLARAAGAPVIGFARESRREPLSALLCAQTVAPGPDIVHVVDQNLALLAATGISGIAPKSRAPDAAYLANLPSPEADAFLASQKRPFALLHPGATRPEKAWGEERFAHLARAFIRDTAITPVVSWGPGDERRAERLRALLPRRPPLPLLSFAGMARVIRESAVFVAGDTGPLHLADALGVPTVALFGQSDPTRNDAVRNGPYRLREGIVADMRAVSDEAVFQLAMRVIRK
ncbi:MAG TPA: lipopolysaccharide heptosyltransferase I [Thermoanaerobaculia bacterium]|jgi:heptosyltransferase-1